MKLIGHFIFFIFLALNGFGQAVIKEIKSGEFIFPVIELQDSIAAQKINDHIGSLAHDSVSREDIQWVTEALATCNEEAEMNNFLLDSTGIIFKKGHCLPHVIQALDADLGIHYSFQELQGKFSAFVQK